MSAVRSAEPKDAVRVAQHHPLQLDTAYGICRHVARSAAKNFYYGFMVLPRRKRNALSAVYAFMRHADDICDDPGMTIPERRVKLHDWLEGYHKVAEGEPTDDPVFLALRDSQHQFGIPIELLDMLVRGTGMDLQEPAGQPSAQPVVAYQSFSELYDYCYHVASVVGLVCIRIFGYRDRAAEPLAEHVGIAFQLTNILRDIKEDAQMGRIYLPGEDLAQHGITAEALASGAELERLRPLLQMEARRARDYYAAAEQLLPLIDDDAQPALWVLVEIYRRLLERIEQRNYDVYSERIRLSVAEKLGVLCKGWIRRLT
ncbi:MAG: phytoene/squalene synthase family protein [Candidatus Korobacteraceae bacterium]|jgi:phytoene synthase